MSNDCIVINSSPLITLCKSNQEDLLPQLFNSIVAPAAVWQEITTSPHSDLAAVKLPLLSWAKRDDSIFVPPLIQAWDLGAGESEVLAYAFAHPEYVAVLDDSTLCTQSQDILRTATN